MPRTTVSYHRKSSVRRYHRPAPLAPVAQGVDDSSRQTRPAAVAAVIPLIASCTAPVLGVDHAAFGIERPICPIPEGLPVGGRPSCA